MQFTLVTAHRKSAYRAWPFAVSRASQRLNPDTRLDDIPEGLARFALNEVAVEHNLDRSRRYPDTLLTG